MTSCNNKVPYVAGNSKETICTESVSRCRAMKKPLKKMLAKSTIIEYCTAWVSVWETTEIAKPRLSEVKSKARMIIA